MNDEVKAATADDPILKEIAELDEGIEKMVAENQRLGEQIDGIRNQRRAVNEVLYKLQNRRSLLATSLTNEAVRSVVVSGATVVASGKELLQAMVATLEKKG